MRGELSPPRPTPSKPVGGEMVLPGFRIWAGSTAGDSGFHIAGQREVGMVEGVEHLHVEAQVSVSVMGNLR